MNLLVIKCLPNVLCYQYKKLFLSLKQSKFRFDGCLEGNAKTLHKTMRGMRVITESSVNDQPFILICYIIQKCKGTLIAWRSCHSDTWIGLLLLERLFAIRLWVHRSPAICKLDREAGGASCGLGLSLLVFLLQAPVFLPLQLPECQESMAVPS